MVQINKPYWVSICQTSHFCLIVYISALTTIYLLECKKPGSWSGWPTSNSAHFLPSLPSLPPPPLLLTAHLSPSCFSLFCSLKLKTHFFIVSQIFLRLGCYVRYYQWQWWSRWGYRVSDIHWLQWNVSLWDTQMQHFSWCTGTLLKQVA